MWFASVAGLFTRQHAIASMNAAAGVLNAVNKGDQAETDRKMDEWKTTNENLLKYADFQQKAYEDAVNKEQGIWEATALSFKDELAASLHTEEDKLKYLNDMDAHNTSLREATMRMAELEETRKSREANEDANRTEKTKLKLMDLDFKKTQLQEKIQEAGTKQSNWLATKEDKDYWAGQSRDLKQQMFALDKEHKEAMDSLGAAKLSETQDEFGQKIKLSYGQLGEKAREADQRSHDTELSIDERRDAATIADAYRKQALAEKTRDDLAKEKLATDSLGFRELSEKDTDKYRYDVLGEKKNQDKAREEDAQSRLALTGARTKLAEERFKLSEQRFQGQVPQDIINQLPNYPNMSRNDLGYVPAKDASQIAAAFTSINHIENTAAFVQAHPESAGLLAAVAKTVNTDALKSLTSDNKDGFASGLNDVSVQIDAGIDSGGFAPDDAANAKILNKMLTTQAFNDAAQSGTKGATIYLDKAFREIYDQASRPDTLLRILHIREKDADDMVLSRWGTGSKTLAIENRTDLDNFPFLMTFGANPESVARLRADPSSSNRKLYDDAYGAGAARRALGF